MKDVVGQMKTTLSTATQSIKQLEREVDQLKATSREQQKRCFGTQELRDVASAHAGGVISTSRLWANQPFFGDTPLKHVEWIGLESQRGGSCSICLAQFEFQG